MLEILSLSSAGRAENFTSPPSVLMILVYVMVKSPHLLVDTMQGWLYLLPYSKRLATAFFNSSASTPISLSLNWTLMFSDSLIGWFWTRASRSVTLFSNNCHFFFEIHTLSPPYFSSSSMVTPKYSVSPLEISGFLWYNSFNTPKGDYANVAYHRHCFIGQSTNLFIFFFPSSIRLDSNMGNYCLHHHQHSSNFCSHCHVTPEQ